MHADRYLGGNLSDRAYEGWHGFARDQGVTVVALMEALGLKLADLQDVDRLPPILREAVRDARRIAAQRRARGRADG